MGMAAPTYWTVDTVRALPDDGNRYELVYGELLVTPAPRPWHQIVAGRLFIALDSYLRLHPVGHAFAAAADITWGRQDVLVQPDLFVASLEEVRALDWERLRTLLLVAEILSPSSLKHDRFTKRCRYQDARVPLYWIVDPDERMAEVWGPTDSFPAIERDRLVWHPAGAAVPFSLALTELFAPV
jgi:Uma2 family endonuclease